MIGAQASRLPSVYKTLKTFHFLSRLRLIETAYAAYERRLQARRLRSSLVQNFIYQPFVALFDGFDVNYFLFCSRVGFPKEQNFEPRFRRFDDFAFADAERFRKIVRFRRKNIVLGLQILHGLEIFRR